MIVSRSSRRKRGNVDNSFNPKEERKGEEGRWKKGTAESHSARPINSRRRDTKSGFVNQRNRKEKEGKPVVGHARIVRVPNKRGGKGKGRGETN